MSQSRHGYLMTQEFCYMAVVITTCDFKKVHKCVIKESTGRLWRKLAPVRLAPISKSVPFEHPGRGTEQLKLASWKLTELRSKSSLLLFSLLTNIYWVSTTCQAPPCALTGTGNTAENESDQKKKNPRSHGTCSLWGVIISTSSVPHRQEGPFGSMTECLVRRLHALHHPTEASHDVFDPQGAKYFFADKNISSDGGKKNCWYRWVTWCQGRLSRATSGQN